MRVRVRVRVPENGPVPVPCPCPEAPFLCGMHALQIIAEILIPNGGS